MSHPDLPSAEGGDTNLVVRVDHDVCSGTAHCQQSMPDVFVVINRKSCVRTDVDWSTVDVDQLQLTADACPWFAISIISPSSEGS